MPATANPRSRRKPAPTIPAGEIVGLAEIARRLGVTAKTAYSWRIRAQQTRQAAADRGTADGLRQPLPGPDGHVGGTVPWWFWSATILPWARATGRLLPNEEFPDGLPGWTPDLAKARAR
jgi:hypothetical protein